MLNIVLLVLFLQSPFCPGLDYPAVMSLYDPDLGGYHCDDDCTTVATGPLEEWMYEQAGACPAELLGSTVHFPAIDYSMQCVDTGTLVIARWSERDEQCVVYFDAMWHLPDEDGDGRPDRNEQGKIEGIPYWAYYFVEDWTVTWGSDYHHKPGELTIPDYRVRPKTEHEASHSLYPQQGSGRSAAPRPILHYLFASTPLAVGPWANVWGYIPYQPKAHPASVLVYYGAVVE